MTALRYDITTRDWVIIAPERGLRPRAAGTSAPAVCPFCPGHEHFAGPDILTVRGSDGGWRVRVIPNKFPALRIEENVERREEGRIFHSMGGCGAHEVLIESPDHDVRLWEQPAGHVEAVLAALQDRHNALLGDPRFELVSVFKNHGAGAGSSIAHPHWQIIATPVVPRHLSQRQRVASDFFERTGECIHCVLLREELRAGTRILSDDADYVALLPFASSSPFQVWILPKDHHSSFGRARRDLLRPLSALLIDVLARLDEALGNPDFNLTISTVPRGEERRDFLWHVEIVPRLTTAGGFELGSSMSINPVPPEDAARHLRSLPGRSGRPLHPVSARS